VSATMVRLEMLEYATRTETWLRGEYRRFHLLECSCVGGIEGRDDSSWQHMPLVAGLPTQRIACRCILTKLFKETSRHPRQGLC
jgi:hypothetical protein